MNIRRAAAAGLALCVVLLQLWALPANAEWRDGPCREGEGQTVIVDWSLTPDAGSGTELIRCILLDDSEGYPDRGATAQGTEAVLASAAIRYAFVGVIADVN
ncbi:MAG: hypothetical protein GX596_12950, partial [Propionibacterium sp.]|nr:hypothetical protein [Propionibacterium sp.]